METKQEADRFFEIITKLRDDWMGGLLTLGEVSGRINNLARQCVGDPEFRGMEIVIGSYCCGPDRGKEPCRLCRGDKWPEQCPQCFGSGTVPDGIYAMCGERLND